MVAHRETDSNRTLRVAARIINTGALFSVEMSSRALPLIDFARICRANVWIDRQETSSDTGDWESAAPEAIRVSRRADCSTFRETPKIAERLLAICIPLGSNDA